MNEHESPMVSPFTGLVRNARLYMVRVHYKMIRLSKSSRTDDPSRTTSDQAVDIANILLDAIKMLHGYRDWSGPINHVFTHGVEKNYPRQHIDDTSELLVMVRQKIDEASAVDLLSDTNERNRVLLRAQGELRDAKNAVAEANTLLSAYVTMFDALKDAVLELGEQEA